MDTTINFESEEKDDTQLINEKVKLEDGSYNYIFSRTSDDSNKNHWRCNICDVIVGGSLSKHALGRKHQAGMSLGAHPVFLWNKTSVPKEKSVLDLKLAPGEPVPPGFENEVRGVTEIQASLDAYHSGPLIGLEYLIELSAYSDPHEPAYICLLCDKRGDPRTVMAHLVSFNHRMTYLQTHFPTAYRGLAPFAKQHRRNVQHIASAICQRVEERYGRMKPQAADKDSFDRLKDMYVENVSKETHPSERMGETFADMVDKEQIMAGPKDAMVEIKKANEEQFKGRYYRKSGSVPGSKRDPSPPVVAAPAVKKASKQERRSLSSISSISSSSLSSPRSKSRSRSRSRSRYIRRSRSPPPRRYYRKSYSRSPPPKYRREAYPATTRSSRLPWQRPDYGRSRGHHYRQEKTCKNDRLEEFKKQSNKIEQEMEKILEEHEKNPEKHPSYPEEWKKFWNRRYKELQLLKIDASKHDFKPEWIDFWNKRMKELHDLEIKSRKDALRKRLNLPEDPQPISFKITKKPKELLESEVIIIDDSKDDEIRDQKRPFTPEEKHKRYGPSKPDTYRTFDPSKPDHKYYYKPKYYFREKSPQKDEEINIVAVLRLLTALEEKLGSLGPKIIDLLSQALALEKNEANSAETLLDNEINCVLFETVKEKLKGQVLAGMVEGSNEKNFKNAIQKIATLLHFASERKKIVKPVKIPGIGSIDREEIAKQIAGALIAQGKTDVTQSELEQLINAVIGMKQASLETGKPVSTAKFIQQEKPVILNKFEPVSMDSLSDSELKTLLQNFKDLSTDEQHSLITYLKKLESREPERVEKLRKFVKLPPENIPGRVSPFANRETGANPSLDDLQEKDKISPNPPLKIESDDEDYTFEDILKTASQNVKEKEAKKLEESNKNNFTDAKTIIATLMTQLGQKNSTSGLNNLLNLTPTPQPSQSIQTITSTSFAPQNLFQNPPQNFLQTPPQNLFQPRPSFSNFGNDFVNSYGQTMPNHPQQPYERNYNYYN